MSECYYCGHLSTSVEHVPPKAIFPEIKDTDGIDYRRNLITVPSCDEHNLAKNLNDEYLLVLLTLNSFKNSVGQGQFDTKMTRIVRKKPDFVSHVLETIRPMTIFNTKQEVMEKAQAFQVDLERYNSILDHIARGLWYHDFGTMFDSVIDIYINGLRYNSKDTVFLEYARAEEELFFLHKDKLSRGDNPDVFRYQFVDVADNVKDLIMIFYGYMMVIIRMGGTL